MYSVSVNLLLLLLLLLKGKIYFLVNHMQFKKAPFAASHLSYFLLNLIYISFIKTTYLISHHDFIPFLLFLHEIK